MNKLIFCLLITAAFFTSCSSGTSTTIGTFADLPADAKKIPYPESPELVRVVVPDINDNVAAEGDYLRGFRHGVWTEYHPGGVVKTVTSYVDGKRQGPQLAMDQNGQLQERINFYNDQLHGKYVKYNRNKIKEEREYEFGTLNGLVKIYHDNGKLMEESPYANDQRNGLARWYNTEGEVIIEYLYKNGEWIKVEAAVSASDGGAE